ncbi:hypothetical protein [Blastococcus sp. TF02A-26]|uniref:hypothetical protein n=1 Tax=Blastococcus sp. TF02A-26 TaxID=2250577 RepID=UPI000DEB1BFC|nr:hypothetical protein [Blastococcus sp. TF02A-26]RBY89927.1 hypothetical protein DQ240_03255 [Blastococcus sp. TF02A-26]
MADYSEFPTTPTAWQEQALRELTAGDPATPAVPAPQPAPEVLRRRPDVVALVAGLVFVFLALVGLSPTEIPLGVFDGGVLWVGLVVAGIALLVSEVRRARRRG